MRATWKGPFIDLIILKRVDSLLKFKTRKKIVKILSRRSIIFPSFFGISVAVFNGKNFVIFCISKNMVGHKFGEFALTKKFTHKNN
jgi:small subunit ribosomal protein S19|uniref:Small ribosomal subunit protein uS19c n=1 Tax=Baffinella frigidus TaxID=2571260 RepID=A0A6C0X6F3_9CRYP|nr:ribosomal protein S19 [Cryptophyta sp. CCMP2293]